MDRKDTRQKDTRQEGTTDRRAFLTAAGLTAAAVATIPAIATGQGTARKENAEEQVRARYRLTPHIERFYFLNSL